MAEYGHIAQVAKAPPAVERAAGARDVLGSNSDQQCALQQGCGGNVPPLDELFWEGFAEEHVGLMGDIAQVTSRAMELQGKMPSPEHAAILDTHIDGIFGLEEALAKAITNVQGRSSYGDEGALELDAAGVEVALDLWDRIEVALDLLREHNGMYAAVLAADLTGKLTRLSLLAQAVVEAGLERTLADSQKRMKETFAAFEASWKVAALSVAKLPADIGVDIAVGAGITAAMPLLIGVGWTGTIPALFVAGGIALAGAIAWNAASNGEDLYDVG